MYKLHVRYIQEAYPNAYHFVQTGVSKVAKKDVPAKLVEDTESDSESSGLSIKEISTLHSKAGDSSWLVGINNCLINAITDAAGAPRATGAEVVAIRAALGVPVGTMLYATRRNLNIILQILGIRGRGAVVLYEGDNHTDESDGQGAHPLFIYHDGINHFTALHNQNLAVPATHIHPTLGVMEENYKKGIESGDKGEILSGALHPQITAATAHYNQGIELARAGQMRSDIGGEQYAIDQYMAGKEAKRTGGGRPATKAGQAGYDEFKP